jgi:hypothetical protein
MKPNTKSMFFKLSLLCLVLFVSQTVLSRIYVGRIVQEDKSSSLHLVSLFYWLGVLWVALAVVLYYKTTRFKQSFVRQALVFVLSPIALSPIIGVVYVVIVLLPIYNLAGNGFIK